MANKNLLELVQDLLSETDGDEVNSINDTEEAYSAARTFQIVYESLYSTKDFPEHFELIQLAALGDTTRPTHMKIPDDVKRVVWLKYNKETASDSDLNFVDLEYCSPTVFLERSYSLNESDTEVEKVTDISGIELLVKNDSFPLYWTSFDDEYVVFNSYDSDEETTVQASRSLAYVNNIPPFNLSDSFIVAIGS